MLQPSGDFIRPYHTAYLTTKFTNLLSQLKHFCVNVTKRFISSSYKRKRQHTNGDMTLWAASVADPIYIGYQLSMHATHFQHIQYKNSTKQNNIN